MSAGPANDAGIAPAGIASTIEDGLRLTAPFFERAVFIAGMGRSGTTLLLRLIDGHSEVFTVPNESMLLTHYLPDFGHTRTPSTVVGGMVGRYRKMMRSEDRLAEGIAHLSRSIPLSLKQEAKVPRLIFRDLLAALALEHPTAGKSLWLEKTPKNELHLEEIFENFPKAKIVFNIRDPRAVYASYIKGKVPNTTPAGIAKSWSHRLSALLNFLASHPARSGRIFFTRYEDYVANPDIEIPRLLKFLGIDSNVEVKPTIFGEAWSGNSFDSSANTPGRIDDKKINAWRNEISPEDARIIARDAALEMSIVGYKD